MMMARYSCTSFPLLQAHSWAAAAAAFVVVVDPTVQ